MSLQISFDFHCVIFATIVQFIAVDASGVERSDRASSEDRPRYSQFHFLNHSYICVAGI